jgi:hypothetical protein
MSEQSTRWTLCWKLFHAFIIGLLSYQVAYSVFVVFVVLAPDGQLGQLGALADGLTLEQMMPRRLYAIEGWMAGCTLVLYLTFTEILPRKHGSRIG